MRMYICMYMCVWGIRQGLEGAKLVVKEKFPEIRVV